MDLKAYLSSCRERIDDALNAFLPNEDDFPASLHSAMRYSVFAGGKRLRPVLMLAACEAVGGDGDKALPVACAMEMIHTYSLIHDDLPAMDNDDFRRGRPTTHRVYGEAGAILAGDALLTEAFALLSNPRGLDPALSLRIMGIIARASGSRGMVGGQVVDMESEGKSIDLPTLEYIHTHKTGALILAAVQSGALVGGADDEAFEALTRYAEAVGLAFQVADDILDIVGTQEEIGKDVGSDQERNKATYPALIGLRESRNRASELVEKACSALSPLGPEAAPLRHLALHIVERSS